MSDSNRFINQSNFSKLGSNILSETSRLTVLFINFIYDRAYFKYATFISSIQHDLLQPSGEKMHFTTTSNQVVMFTDCSYSLPSLLASVFRLSDAIYPKLFWICKEDRANFFPWLQRILNNVPNSSHFNFPPLAAVAPMTSGPAAAVRNYFKRPLAGHRGAFKLFKDDIKTPRSTPLTNMSHQGNKYTFFFSTRNMLFPVQMQLFVTAHMQIQSSTQARTVYSEKD